MLFRSAQWAGRNVERDPETGEVVRKEPQPEPRAALPQAAPQAAPKAVSEPQGIEAIIAQKAADLERQAGRTMSPEARALFNQREMNKFLSQEKIVPPSPASAPPAAPVATGPSAPPAAMPRQASAAPRQAPAPAPAPPPAPQGIMDAVEQKKNLDVIRGRRDVDPAERERIIRERLQSEVGAPEVTGLESLAQEIASKREKLAQRANPLQDLLRGIALSPRGERWWMSGSRGADYADKQQAAREAEDFGLAQKLFETQTKIADVKRGWKKDLFTIGREEFNTTYKEAYDAAKEMGRTDDAAKKMAQDAVLEREKMANAVKVAGISAGPQLAAGARLDKAIADMMAKNKGMTYSEAYEAVTKPSAYLAPDKQRLSELKVLQQAYKDMADPNKNLDPESQKEAARKYALITDEIAKMSKLDLGGSEPVAVTVGGKTYSFPNQAAADKFKAQAGIK